MTKEKAIEKVKEKFNDANVSALEYMYQLLQPPKADYKEFVDNFNKEMKSKCRYGDNKAKRQLNLIRKEGFTIDDDNKVFKAIQEDNYHNETDFRYVTPEYVTRMHIYEKFLNSYREPIKQVYNKAVMFKKQ